MEASQTLRDIKEGENFFESAGKTALRTLSSAVVSGYTGAIGSKFGPAGSIIGLGLGAIVNAKAAQLINQENS